ncbi:MAG: class A beta-lactamase-related serine hydrolase [Lentisphaeria bacterium]|nr:class A beta-lactamase-related serine hydrolase [Candidatus Neomarinimicrobiota bacterium]MCF7841416.1 class A beta-lactamase-related serine hydrolase [Lentisphaeria bacterium]
MRFGIKTKIGTVMLTGILLMNGCALWPFGGKSEVPDEDERRVKMVAVAYRNLGTDEVKVYRPMEIFHAASTMKTPVMFQLYKMRDAGQLSMTDSVVISNEFQSILDGSVYRLPVSPDDPDGMYAFMGKRMAIRDLIDRMITWSSNLATNLLIDLADPVQIAETMREIEAIGVLVLRGVEDLKAYEAGLNNRTSAAGMMNVMTAVYRSNLVSDSSRREMIEILKNQHYNDMIPKELPPEVQVAHKTGSITRIAHDAAIVFPAGNDPYVLVILTSGYDDISEAHALGAKISRRIYNYHINPDPNKIVDISDLVPIPEN